MQHLLQGGRWLSSGLSGDRGPGQRRLSDYKGPAFTLAEAPHGSDKISLSLRTNVYGEAMADDAIFRIYSMTKPFTSVAALILMEEGALQLSTRSRSTCRSSPRWRSSPATTPSPQSAR
jgi:hypothetical protein